MFHSLRDAIRQIFGTDRTVAQKQRVSGGDINDAYALTLDDGTPLFMKSNMRFPFRKYLSYRKVSYM